MQKNVKQVIWRFSKMKIPQKIKYIVNDKEEEFDFYKFIKESCSCAFGSSLSEYFQVFYDTPSKALYRINTMIDKDNAWVGQLVSIDLDKKTIGIENDCAIKGQSTNLYDMKANGIIQNHYNIISITW